MNTPPITYRPSRAVGGGTATLFLATSAVLVWLGFVLTPDDADAIDGVTRLLFTVISIRFFAWVMALAFALLGLRLAGRLLYAAPSLRLSADGLRIGLDEVPWAQVTSVSNPSPDLLRVEVGEVRRHDFSPFDLGTDPREAARQIEGFRSAGTESTCFDERSP